MMPSSVAAACSSKLKPWQNFLRSARPQARLMRLPKGACSTSCMPPDSYDAVAYPQNAPRGVAELEHVARQRFDGEVLVQRADEVTFGLEDHSVIEYFRDRAAIDDRAHARAFARPQLVVQRVVVQER